MKGVLLILLMLNLLPCLAQKQRQELIDSLQQELVKNHPDTTRADLLNKLAMIYQNVEPDKTITYGKEALDLIKNQGEQARMAKSYLSIGVGYKSKSEFKKGLEYLKRAASLLEQQPNPKLQCMVHESMGFMYLNLHDYPNMLNAYYQALKFAELTGNEVFVAKVLGSIALGQSYTGNYQLAEKNFKKAIHLLEKADSKNDLLTTYQNLGLMYNFQHRHQKAEKIFKHIINIAGELNNQKSLMLAHGNLADTYVCTKDYDKAIKHSEISLAMQRSTGFLQGLNSSLTIIASSYYGSVKDSADSGRNVKPYNMTYRERLIASANYFEQSLALGKQSQDLRQIMKSSNLLHEVYSWLGNNQQALHHYKEYVTARDSLYTAADKKKVATLEAERETELKQKELEIQGLKLHKAETQRYYLAGAAFLFLLLSGSLYNRFRLKTRKNRELQIAYTDLQKLQEELLQKEKSLFAKALLETELKALRAQMNPHFIFNCLNSIQAFILRENRHDATDYLQKFSRLIRLILDNSQKTSTTLEDEKEILTLYLELERLRLKGKFDFEIEIDEDLDAEFTEFPSMVIQPLVENSIWHGLMPSEAHGHLRIFFRKEDEQLVCVVEDNGIGIARSQELKGLNGHQSKGMKLIQDRLNAWSQTREMSSHVRVLDTTTYGAGTRTEITIQTTPVYAKPQYA